MNDRPSILIEYDPETWEITTVYFKTNTDVETAKLKEILKDMVRDSHEQS